MKKYYLIDHKVLFLFGYCFYLIIPYYVGVSGVFSDFAGMDLYYGYFNKIPKEKLDSYIWITLSWLIAFFLGHFCFKMLVPGKKSLALFPPTAITYNIKFIGILLTVILLIFAFMGRNILFSGYAVYELNVRGKMNTLLMVFDFFLVYQLVTAQKVSWYLIIGTILTNLISLSLGGRTYVIQSLMVFLIYKTSFANKRWNRLQLLTVAIIGFLVGSYVGLWRIGSSFSLQNASYSLLAEPVFTWFSTSTFLTTNDIPIGNFPANFITSFLNLVPNTILSLDSYIVPTKAMGYTYENPLGADSVWTTYIINFGTIGSFFFLFITGFILNFLRHLSTSNRFAAAYYILVCGLLPFQFFRDGFFIINKQLFFNFLFFPALLIMGLKLIFYLHCHVPQRPDVSSVPVQ